MSNWDPEGDATNSLLSGLLWFLLIFGALMIGYVIGSRGATPPDNAQPDSKLEKPEKTKKAEEAGKAPAKD
jgi:hypothetical protein